MSLFEDLPFARGTTYYDGGTIDTNDLPTHMEGKEYIVDDVDYSVSTTGTKTNRSAKKVRLRIVRNTSGIALLPKRLVRFDTTAGRFGLCVSGYTTTTAADWAGVVDEWLPAAGVPNNDYFYIVVQGPSVCLMPLSDTSADIGIGNRVVSITAATSQATTAGRITERSLAVTEAILGNAIENVVGYALTAKVTDDTNDDILVDLVGKY